MALLASGFWSCVSFAVASLTNANANALLRVTFFPFYLYLYLDGTFFYRNPYATESR